MGGSIRITAAIVFGGGFIDPGALSSVEECT